jgi:hypothetical protein
MKLHELLAVEKQHSNQVNVLIQDTLNKFGKEHFFKGWIKRLKLLKDSPENAATETAGSETREVVTTVNETLDYLFKHWAESEDLQFKKNRANQVATTPLTFGKVIIHDVPIDELMGLEARLTKLREVFQAIPTLDATKTWEPSQVRTGVLKATHDEVTTKTEKVFTAITLYEATKEHPAQIKEVGKDEVVGTFTNTIFSGAISSLKKANALYRIDSLIGEVKKARMRANCQEVSPAMIGEYIAHYLLEPLE